MSQDNWEQIHYHQLPDWMKKVADSGQRNTSNQTKIFSGILYDYRIEYTVKGDIVSISYWRSVRREKPVTLRKPALFAVVLLLCVLAVGVAYLGLPQFFVPGLNPPDTSNSLSDPGAAPEKNFTSDHVNAPAIPGPGQESRLLQSPKVQSYYYFIENSRKSISLTMYGGLAENLSGLRHSSLPGSDKEVIARLLANQHQDEYLKPLIESIVKRSPAPDDPAKIAISLVQHVPYTRNQPFNTSSGWLYPYETLYRNAGTSADKSILAAYLLKELGYDTVVFEFPGSMAVGVRCSPEYDFYDSGYAFIEPTVPTIITYVPESRYGGFSVSAPLRIITVSDGKRPMDVSPEFRDASRLKQLERLGGVLNQMQYTELQKISNKYDMQISR
jgi:hypothetical protein